MAKNSTPTPQPLAPPEHFWSPNTATHYDIASLSRSPASYPLMDTVINAWDGILRHCFPDRATTPGGPCYSIPLTRHQGAWRDGWGRSIVVEKLQIMGEVKLGVRPSVETEDVMWLELAPLGRGGSVEGWARVVRMAGELLGKRYPGERMLLVVVVGFRWMAFWWDPVGERGGGLVMKGEEGEEWVVDSRVSLVRQGEVQGDVKDREPEAVTINPLRDSYDLDFWTLVEEGKVANLKNLEWLEKLLISTRSDVVPSTEEASGRKK